MTLLEYLQYFDPSLNLSTFLRQSALWSELESLWSQIDWQDSKSLDSVLGKIQTLLREKSHLLNWNDYSSLQIWQIEEKDKQDLQEKENQTSAKNKEQDLLLAELGVLNLRPIRFQGQNLGKLKNRQQVEALTAELTTQYRDFRVVSLKETRENYKPPAPFITSTLQQAASSALGFSPKVTMELAQKLYEGVLIDGEPIALITYMRTDSVNLSQEALQKIRTVINQYTPQFLPKQPNIYQSKKTAQEAHEAIRPTNPLLHPKNLQTKIDKRLWQLYHLIWRRSIACQMTDYILCRTHFELENTQKTAFAGSFTRTISLGWKFWYPEQVTSTENWLKQQWLAEIEKSLESL